MLLHAVSHARLMRESTDRVRTASLSSDGGERLVATRLLENPTVWQQWEVEHSTLMRQLANCSLRRVQVTTLKQTTFRLLHARALFHYLRRSEVRGRQRAQVMAHFRPGRDYAHAVVAEHNVYLRKAMSYLCANHLGSEVVADPTFLDPIRVYEQLYTEYFNVYCSTFVQDAKPDVVSQQGLLPLLKQQLNEYRLAILDPRRAQPFLRREAELREKTGDTQRLPTLGPMSRPKPR